MLLYSPILFGVSVFHLLIHGTSQAAPRLWVLPADTHPCPAQPVPHLHTLIANQTSVAQYKGLKAVTRTMVLLADGVTELEACLPLLPRPRDFAVSPVP